MARADFFLALIACACISSANAALKICDANAKPAKPTGVALANNIFNAAAMSAEVTVMWTNPTTENTGCTDFYRIQTFINGKQVAEDGLQLSNTLQGGPGSSKLSYTKKGLKAGDRVHFKIYGMNKATQKKSDSATSDTVVMRGAGATTGRKMM